MAASAASGVAARPRFVRESGGASLYASGSAHTV